MGEEEVKSKEARTLKLFFFFFFFFLINGISGSILLCALYISLFSGVLGELVISSPM